ncbi:MAG: inositol monophosphatase family protein [Actinomycetota bacterium]|nr:inositol monophosphatase family protein [Actinomycetota bacterium]
MDDLQLAIGAARAGGTILREGFDRGVTAHYKRRFDPVTEIDHASEDAVLSIISEHRPNDAVLAEERGGTIPGGRLWIVDPLDGTVNFVHGIPQVAVSVGLWEDDRPLAGVIYDPLRDECFSAAAGQGAHLNGRQIHVSSTADLDRSVTATGFPYDHGDYPDEYATVLAAVLGSVNGIRRFGSAALDLAWVAAGRYEAYWELGLAPWDQAAGILIVREAGGRVTDFHGDDSVAATPMVLSSNGLVHDALQRILEPAIPDHHR